MRRAHLVRKQRRRERNDVQSQAAVEAACLIACGGQAVRLRSSKVPLRGGEGEGDFYGTEGFYFDLRDDFGVGEHGQIWN